jgi:hypothetical protein
MALLVSCYPDYALKDGTMEAYWMFLNLMDGGEFERAVELHISQSKFFPKINEILSAALTLRNQGRPSAAERWGQLVVLAEQGAPAPTDTPTLRALSTVGGWDGFQFTAVNELVFRRKEFERVYTEALAEEDRLSLLGLEGPQVQKRLEG